MTKHFDLATMPPKDLLLFQEVLETIERAATKNRDNVDMVTVLVGLFDPELSDALSKQVAILTHIIDLAQNRRETVKARIKEELS